MPNQIMISEISPAAPVRLRPLTAQDSTEERVDLSALLAFQEISSPGQSDIVVELIDLYLKDGTERVHAIKTAAARADAILLKQTAHTLKGSSASLGLVHIAEICEKLEHANLNDPSRGMEVLVQLLQYKFSRVCAALLAMRQTRTA